MEINVEIIRLSEVLKIMDQSLAAFDVSYFTYSGELKVRKNCRLTGTGRNGERAPAGTPPAASGQAPAAAAKPAKNPNHFENATRNIIKQNGQIRTMPIFLIIKFNGKKVII